MVVFLHLVALTPARAQTAWCDAATEGCILCPRAFPRTPQSCEERMQENQAFTAQQSNCSQDLVLQLLKRNYWESNCREIRQRDEQYQLKMKRKHEQIHSEGKMKDYAHTQKPPVLWNSYAIRGSIAVIRYWSGRRRPSIILSAWPSYDPRRREGSGDVSLYACGRVLASLTLIFTEQRSESEYCMLYVPCGSAIRMNLQICVLQLLGGEYADICAQGALRPEAAVTGVRIAHITLSRIPARRPCLDGLHVAMDQVVHVCVYLPYGCMYAETWATTASALWLPSLSATWPNWQRCKLLLSLLDFHFHILVNATHYQCSLSCLLPVPNRFKFLWDIFLRSIACLFNVMKASLNMN